MMKLQLYDYFQKEEELLSSWWKEYADCSEGPRAPKASSSKLDAQLRSSVLESAGSPQLFTPEEERVGVPVKGGLYEVSLILVMIVSNSTNTNARSLRTYLCIH